ncbi:hypothetical protein PS914_05146 [Pseudomonas fluorescens]|nr:hypothetical protein PS914_05146 [Pseudomonas fluorescens]
MRSDWLEHALEPKMKVGVISDTHGLLRAEAVAALEGCERSSTPATSENSRSSSSLAAGIE